MPKYIIEREMPEVGKLSHADLQAAFQKFCSVIVSLGHKTQWVESYVTVNKVYCVYQASNFNLIQLHAGQVVCPPTASKKIKT